MTVKARFRAKQKKESRCWGRVSPLEKQVESCLYYSFTEVMAVSRNAILSKKILRKPPFWAAFLGITRVFERETSGLGWTLDRLGLLDSAGMGSNFGVPKRLWMVLFSKACMAHFYQRQAGETSVEIKPLNKELVSFTGQQVVERIRLFKALP